MRAVALTGAEHMTAVFVELFPDAPTHGLVSVGMGRCWRETK